MNQAALIVLLVWVLAALVSRVLGIGALRRLVRASDASEPSEAVPGHSVVLVRSMHGAPPRFGEAFTSLCEAGRAGGAPVLAACSTAADDAVAASRLVSRGVPGVTLDLRVGTAPSGRNPKMRTLVAATRDDRSEILILTDADVRVPVDHVARHGAAFRDPAVGLATCPYRSVRHRSFVSRLDAAVTNVHFLPFTCLAVELEGLHFGLGASIAVRRTALEKAGRFEALVDEPADDYRLARNVEEAGFRLAWVPQLVDHLLEDEGFLRAARRHVRWSGTVRVNRPAGYLGLAATHGVIPLLVSAVIDPCIGVLAAGFFWVASALWLIPVRRAIGFGVLDLLLLPLTDACAAMVWLLGLVAPAGVPGAHRAGPHGSRH